MAVFLMNEVICENCGQYESECKCEAYDEIAREIHHKAEVCTYRGNIFCQEDMCIKCEIYKQYKDSESCE